MVGAKPTMDAEVEASLYSLSEGIDRRKRDAATYRAFVMLHAESLRSSAPTVKLTRQPLPAGLFDFSSEH
jgi:hypothetical protein